MKITRIIYILLFLSFININKCLAFKTYCGSYTGNGTSQSITGLGFQPDFIILKRHGGSRGVFATSSMTIPGGFLFASGGNDTNLIQSFDSDGFSIGSSSSINTSANSYSYCAATSDGIGFKVGSYTGNGGSKSITGVGFRPTACLIRRNSSSFTETVWRTSNMTGTLYLGGTGGSTGSIINSLDSDGFSLGSNDYGNTNATTYFYACWKDSVGVIKTGTYTGDGTDNRSISGVGFFPDWAVVQKSASSAYQHLKATTATNDTSYEFGTLNGSFTNKIQKRQSDGFEVGSGSEVNSNTLTYFYFAFLSGSSSNILSNGGEVFYGGNVSF